MSQHESSGYCPHCKKRVLAKKTKVNHILHVILAICTCGLWLIVWAVLGKKNENKPWVCSECGVGVDMDVNISYCHCPECQKETTVIRKKNADPDHVMHLVISILTFGVWLPVWFFISRHKVPWICGVCKKEVSSEEAQRNIIIR